MILFPVTRLDFKNKICNSIYISHRSNQLVYKNTNGDLLFKGRTLHLALLLSWVAFSLFTYVNLYSSVRNFKRFETRKLWRSCLCVIWLDRKFIKSSPRLGNLSLTTVESTSLVFAYEETSPKFTKRSFKPQFSTLFLLSKK